MSSFPQSPTIGFIGFGQMAQSIWHGVCKNGTLPYASCGFYQRRMDVARQIELEFPTVKFLDLEAVCQADIVVFAIKPQQLPDVLATLPPCRPNCVVSVLAGTPLSSFESAFGTDTPIVRSMPNMPAALQQAMTGIAYGNGFHTAHMNRVNRDRIRTWIEHLFTCIGDIVIVDELHMDVVTAISGSGPGFLCEIAEMIAEIGRAHGLDATVCQRLIAQTMIGTGHLLRQTDITPAERVTSVCSPGGTTESGLSTLRDLNAKAGIQGMIESAIQRAKFLSS